MSLLVGFLLRQCITVSLEESRVKLHWKLTYDYKLTFVTHAQFLYETVQDAL